MGVGSVELGRAAAKREDFVLGHHPIGKRNGTLTNCPLYKILLLWITVNDIVTVSADICWHLACLWAGGLVGWWCLVCQIAADSARLLWREEVLATVN